MSAFYVALSYAFNLSQTLRTSIYIFQCLQNETSKAIDQKISESLPSIAIQNRPMIKYCGDLVSKKNILIIVQY